MAAQGMMRLMAPPSVVASTKTSMVAPLLLETKRVGVKVRDAKAPPMRWDAGSALVHR